MPSSYQKIKARKENTSRLAFQKFRWEWEACKVITIVLSSQCILTPSPFPDLFFISIVLFSLPHFTYLLLSYYECKQLLQNHEQEQIGEHQGKKGRTHGPNNVNHSRVYVSVMNVEHNQLLQNLDEEQIRKRHRKKGRTHGTTNVNYSLVYVSIFLLSYPLIIKHKGRKNWMQEAPLQRAELWTKILLRMI